MSAKTNDVARPTMEDLKRARRVTPEEHARWHSRMGRPLKGADKYVPVGLRLPPEVLAHVKAKAHKQGIKYQTFIAQVLRAA